MIHPILVVLALAPIGAVLLAGAAFLLLSAADVAPTDALLPIGALLCLVVLAMGRPAFEQTLSLVRIARLRQQERVDPQAFAQRLDDATRLLLVGLVAEHPGIDRASVVVTIDPLGRLRRSAPRIAFQSGHSGHPGSQDTTPVSFPALLPTVEAILFGGPPRPDSLLSLGQSALTNRVAVTVRLDEMSAHDRIALRRRLAGLLPAAAPTA